MRKRQRQVNRYVRAVGSYLPCAGKHKKQLLTALRSRLMADKKLTKMAQTSDPQIFVESIFPKAFGAAAQDSYLESQDTYTSLFEDQHKYNAIMSALADVVYREMRMG